MSVGLAVVLHEHEVPYLYHLVVVGVHERGSGHCGPLLVSAQVDVDFAARSARTGLAHLPEIVVLVAQKYMVLRHMLEPGLPGLGVEFGAVFCGTLEHCRIELGLVNAVHLGEQFPGPVYGLGLEIVAEAPVSEHLEHRVVAPVVAHGFEVIVLSADPEAFLAVGGAVELCCGVAEEYVLELVHSRVCEHEGRVVLDYHRR